MSWEEKYVMLLWLSHLMLTPFSLDTVSSYFPSKRPKLSLELPDSVSGVAVSLIVAANAHLSSPGKERNAAGTLLVRLALRPDMQRYHLLNSVFEMAANTISHVSDDTSVSTYRKMGSLAILAGIFKIGSEKDIAPLIQRGYGMLRQNIERNDSYLATSSDAYTRRLIIKVVRMLLARSLTPALSKHVSSHLDDMINFAIEFFVSSLGDRDTPVRVEASKAISLVTRQLGPPDDQSIVEGIVDMLNGSIHFEDATTGRPFTLPLKEDLSFSLVNVLRNVENADGLQWHGVLLALARLLLYRSIALHLLPAIVQTLISGIDFEQRSSKGATSGTQVRDAACFGLWALSRKYSTTELTLQNVPGSPMLGSGNAVPNLVKWVASSLIICACFDPQGNMRRGASAALQELIGRHPDVAEHGIPLVQLIDYQGVASRNRAMQSISCAVALLDKNYWFDLSRAILTWRGIGAADASSRRFAADTLFKLVLQSAPLDLKILLKNVLDMLRTLPSQGSTDKRHGLLLALAVIIDAFTELSCQSEDNWFRGLADNTTQKQTRNEIAGLCDEIKLGSFLIGRKLPFGAPRNLLYESIARLIGSLCKSMRKGTIHGRISSASSVTNMLLECAQANDQETAQVIFTASEELFQTLSNTEQSTAVKALSNSGATPTAGRLLALAGAYRSSIKDFRNNLIERTSFRDQIYAHLIAHVGKDRPVETRCYTWQSLRKIIVTHPEPVQSQERDDVAFPWANEIHVSLQKALNDYTTDHRGDVGSWVRMEAIQALEDLVTHVPSKLSVEKISPLIGSLVRMAAERLDKVRLQAWKSLRVCWIALQFTPKIDEALADEMEVSHERYFAQLLLLCYSSYPQHLIKGFVTSVSGGSEGLAVATRSALVSQLPSRDQLDVLEQTVDILAENRHDDRYAVPCLHLIAFLLDQGLVSSSTNFVKCFAKVELAHFKSANSARLEGALLCYGGLLLQPSSREKSLKKVQILQKHPQIRVRSLADDVLNLYG